MATYTSPGGERLTNLADQFYGEVSDPAIRTIVRANPVAWSGQAVHQSEDMLEVPAQIETVAFPPSYPAEVQRTRAALFTTEPFTLPNPPTERVYISGRNGNEVRVEQWVYEDVIDRVLSYRGDRWWRLLYGTRIVDLFKYFVSLELFQEIESQVRRALAPATEYTLSRVVASASGMNLRVEIAITTNAAPQEEQVITINVDLS